MNSKYYVAKNAFVDSIDVDDYIELDSSVIAFKQLEESLEKPLKLILLFGRPGTGKSILLNRLNSKYKHKKEMYYFDTPVSIRQEFLKNVFQVITNKKLPKNTEVNFAVLVDFCKKMRDQREIIMILDEAQMYSSEIMETVRLLADTRSIKFLLSFHQVNDENLIEKEHFKSRIWKMIELKNVSNEDQAVYIHKKLLKKNLFEVANSLNPKDMKLIYQFTQGNYRECNKFMFTLFEICAYYEIHEPSKIDNAFISKKIIEMAALKLGYIDA